jgi:leader peptidase (prepilin peptidase)/N-methyltransferase
MPPALALALVAALGLAVGSFLNVCIYRLPRGQSIAWPPSRCPSCGRAIRWHHNVPVFGYLALGGRCFDCGGRISAAYPVVEAVTAAVFVLHYQQYGWSAILVVRLAFAAAMIALFTIDLEHQILPNLITVPGIAAGLAASLLVEPGWRSALIGALVGGGLLWLVSEAYFRIRGVEGLGFGDVKMLAMIGAFLGWKLTIVTLCGASLAGAVLGLVLIAAGRGTLQLKLPFGSFLAVSAVLAGLWGQPFVDWYASFYR